MPEHFSNSFKKFLLVFFLCREGGEDADSQGDGSSQPDTISIASRTSQNTVDSDKVGFILENLTPLKYRRIGEKQKLSGISS